MASRKLLRSIVLLAPLAIVPGALVAQGATMQAWCGSDPDGPVVYLSQIFDTGLGRPEPGVDIGGPIAFEFLWYLRGRYDYKTSGNRPTSCGPGTTGYATESRRNFKATAETAGKQVVELEWEFTPDTAAPPAAGAERVGWCFSSGATETVYAAGPFQLKGRISEGEWNIAFGRFLTGKYGLQGGGRCAIGLTLAKAHRLMGFQLQGARAGNRQVVETGWDWSDAASSQADKPADRDDDAEPARPAPPPPPPSVQARDLATKDLQAAMQLCNNDRIVSGAFDCSMVSRAVYNYRIAHWGADATPEPVAELFTGDKLDCSACLKPFASAWAASRAPSQGFALAPAQCVGKRFVELLKAKPYLNRVKEFLDAAMKACPK